MFKPFILSSGQNIRSFIQKLMCKFGFKMNGQQANCKRKMFPESVVCKLITFDPLQNFFFAYKYFYEIFPYT